MTGWILVRSALGQSVLHPWLGSITAGLASAIAACFKVIPEIGPVPEVISNACGIMCGVLFTVGVRYEAVGAPLTARALWVMSAIATTVAVVAEWGLSNWASRMITIPLLVGVAIAAPFRWVPD